MKHRLSENFKEVENLAFGSKTDRFLNDPIKYIFLIVYKNLIYKVFNKGILKSCKTFFDSTMTVQLPSGTDVLLTGGKTHISEIKLTRYLINNLSEEDVVFDIGAHFGFYSLLANKLISKKGSILSFEPCKAVFEILKKNTNNFDSIQIHNLAISNSSGFVIMSEFPPHLSEYNTVIPNIYKEESWYQKTIQHKSKVKSMTLDDFIKREEITPTIIKLDVEGSELNIIKGSKYLLKSYSPVLIVEHHSIPNKDKFDLEVQEQLNNLKYFPYIIDLNGMIKKEDDLAGYLAKMNLETDNVVYKKTPDNTA